MKLENTKVPKFFEGLFSCNQMCEFTRSGFEAFRIEMMSHRSNFQAFTSKQTGAYELISESKNSSPSGIPDCSRPSRIGYQIASEFIVTCRNLIHPLNPLDSLRMPHIPVNYLDFQSLLQIGNSRILIHPITAAQTTPALRICFTSFIFVW